MKTTFIGCKIEGELNHSLNLLCKAQNTSKTVIIKTILENHFKTLKDEDLKEQIKSNIKTQWDFIKTTKKYNLMPAETYNQFIKTKTKEFGIYDLDFSEFSKEIKYEKK
jgi:predicted DNA-binding protein